MCEIDHTPKQIPRIKFHSVNYHLAKLWDPLTTPKYEELNNYISQHLLYQCSALFGIKKFVQD